MGQVTADRTVHAPIEAVWQCLNDIDHTPQWVTGLAAAEIKTPGAYGVGTVYHDTNRLGPVLQVTPWRITVFDPMTRQVHESESTTLPSTMTLNLSPVPDGTQVQMIVHYRFLPRLGAVSRAFEGLVMNRLLKRVLTQNLTSFDAYLA
jgi:uncharacterized protein YndB with AHSA1/START domain